jgi:GH18 family chitinase
VALLQTVREALDGLARSKNEDPRSYDLTIAAVCLYISFGPTSARTLRMLSDSPVGLNIWKS